MRIVASLAFVLSHLAVPSAAAAEYASVGQLMLQAIDAPGGAARGVIVGPVAKKFRDATGSVAPVMAEVTTLKSFRQEGCKRLNVRLKQANVPTDGKLTEFGVDYGLNLCRDGSPPTEGMDLEKAGQVLDSDGAGEGAGVSGQSFARP
jgi:hypothetical protein